MQLNNQGSTPQQNKGGLQKITSLATLRALQKAAKQIKSASSETKNEPINNKVEINDNNEITFEKQSVSPKKAKSPEDQKNQKLRSDFQQALSKLYRTDTLDLAMNELKTLIMNNNTPSSLRVFLSSLTEYKKIPTPTAQECEVSLFGYIASQYKENLIDPLDKNPSLLKTAYRVLETIHSYFKVKRIILKIK